MSNSAALADLQKVLIAPGKFNQDSCERHFEKIRKERQVAETAGLSPVELALPMTAALADLQKVLIAPGKSNQDSWEKFRQTSGSHGHPDTRHAVDKQTNAAFNAAWTARGVQPGQRVCRFTYSQARANTASVVVKRPFSCNRVSGIAYQYHVAPGALDVHAASFTKEMGHRMAHPPSATASSHLPCSISRQQKPRAYANSFLWAGVVLCSFN